ncbi:metal-dependent hydrolase [Alkaliphilus crotonatoxidans]
MDIITHATAGICITYMVAGYKRNSLTIKEKSVLLVSGAFAAITPDITKYFGDLLGHSLLIAPIIVLPIAYLSNLLLKEFRFRILWLSYLLSVVFGHILLDFLHNGVALIYPITQSELSYHIINTFELWILMPLMFSVLSILLFKKPYKIVASLIAVLVLFLGVKSFYRAGLINQLNTLYADDKPREIILQVSKSLRWPYMIRSNYFFIDGVASVNNITEENRLFLSEDGSKDVLLILEEDEQRYIICKPAFNDGELIEFEVYSQEVEGHWRRLDQETALKIIQKSELISNSFMTN